MVVDPQLISFIQMKKSKSSLKDQFTPTDLLDCLEPEIKKLYAVKIEDERDEFDCTIAAMTGPEMVFYSYRFLPTALLKTYAKLHNSTPTSECLEDLFSIGAGAETVSLFPEIMGICDLCAGDYYDDLMDSSEIHNANNIQ